MINKSFTPPASRLKIITSIFLVLMMVLSLMTVGMVTSSAAINMENVMNCSDKPSDFNEFAVLYQSDSQGPWVAVSCPKVAVDTEGNPVCVYGNYILDAYTLSSEEFAVKYGYDDVEPFDVVVRSGSLVGTVSDYDSNYAYNANWGGFALQANMDQDWQQSNIYKIRYIDKDDLYADENVQLCVSKQYDSLQHWYDIGVINNDMTNAEKMQALHNGGFSLWVEIIVEPEMQDIPVATFKRRLASVKNNSAPSSDNTDLTNVITQSGNDGQSIVTLDYETANLKVTVPTVLPVNVDSNNNVTVADNAQISNLSNGSVDVTNAEIQTDEWSVVGFNTDFTKVPVDTKQYGFKLNGDDVSDGVNTSVFNTINGNDHIGLSYDANVAIQSQPITNEDIGRIVFTVAWHK